MENIFNYAGLILMGLAATHTAALAIVNLTPTPKDDEIIAKVYKVIEWLAGVITPKGIRSPFYAMS